MSGPMDIAYNAGKEFNTVDFSTISSAEQTQKLPAVKDVVSSSEAREIQQVVVVPGRPVLPAPSGDSNPKGLDHASMLLTNFPEQIVSFFEDFTNAKASDEGVKEPEEGFSDSVEGQISLLGQKKLASIGHGNAAKGAAMLRFAVFHPDHNFPSELAEMAAAIREKAAETSGAPLSQVAVSIKDQAGNTLFALGVEQKLRSAGLSEEELKQVLFAYDVSEAQGMLPPALQRILKQAIDSTKAQLNEQYGIPDDWTFPTSGGEIKTKLAQELGQQVVKELESQLSSGKIDRAQFNEMRTLLFMPEAQTPNASALKSAVEMLVQEKRSQLQKEFGFPDGFSISPDVSLFKGVLTGSYLAGIEAQLNDPALNLTADQKQVLRQALTAEDAAAALSPEMKTLLQQVQGNALAKVSTAYGLPEGWKPDAGMLAVGIEKMQTLSMRMAFEGLNQGFEVLANGTRLLETVKQSMLSQAGVDQQAAAGAGKIEIRYRDYLKAISNVLMAMQEIMSAQAVSDTNIANLLSKVELDAKMAELESQKKALEEVIAKQKKMASLGPLKALFQWIINIIIMITLTMIGQPHIALILIINTMAQAAKGLAEGKSFGKIFMEMSLVQDIAKSCQDFGKQVGGALGKFLAHFGTLLGTVAVMVLSPLSLLFDLFFGDGTFLKQLFEALGIPKHVADYMAMSFQIIFQLIMAIALSVFTGGASIELFVFQAVEKVSQMAAKIVSVVQQVINAVYEAFKVVFDAIKLVLAPILEQLPEALKAALKAAAEGAQKAAEAVAKHMADMFKQVAPELHAKLQKGMLEGMKESFKELGDIAKKHADTVRNIGTASEEAVKEAEQFVGDVVARTANFVSGTVKVAQASVQLQNSILRAEIARLKAALEANHILVEEFIKILKSVINMLLEAAKGLGQDIKSVIETHKRLVEGLSQVTQELFS